MMPRNDNNNNNNESRQNNSTNENGLSVDRRSYLKFAGIAAGSALLTGTANAASERHGIQFKRTVNMVSEADCDPTGNEPCDKQIRAAADDYTLLKFPSGEYKITEKNVLLGYTNLGFVGEGDVRFKVPENYNEKLLVVDDGTGVLFKNIDIDLTAAGATPGVHLGVDDDLQIHDVEFIGQGIHPASIPRGDPGWSPGLGAENGNPAVTTALTPIVRSSDGTGLVKNVVAKNQGLMGTYNAGSGRIGIWVGITTKGTITFRDCQIEEFGNNGCYTSRTYGVVNFEGGVYRNNDVDQIRIGSPGSSAERAEITVDAEASDSPNPSDALNQRGVRIEMGHNYVPTDVTVSNCDIAIRATPHSAGGVVADPTASQFRIKNTRIGVDVDSIRGVLADSPDGGVYPPPAKPYTGTLQGVSITGTAAGNEGVELRGRPDSVVEDCCIQQEGGNRDGVVVTDANGYLVHNSSINVTSEPVVSKNAAVDVYGISTSGTCPPPTNTPPSDNGPNSNALTIEAAPEAEYELAASESLEKRTTADSNDELSGASVVGQVAKGGRDSYVVTGEITKLVLRGGAMLYYNGEQVDPAEYLQNTVSVQSQSYAEYDITTTDGIVKSAVKGASDPNDDINGTTASGHVGKGGIDSYAYSGEISNIDIEGEATIYRNGEEIDTDEVGATDTLTIEAAPEAEYELAASESLEKRTTADSNDELSGASVVGQVAEGGRDSYVVTGEVTKLVLRGGAMLYYNGEQVDPANYLQNTVSVQSQSYAEYDITTTDGIVKSAVKGASDPNDDINGTTASGHVGKGGIDSYAYSGNIINLAIDGDATVYRNGEVVDPDKVGSANSLTIEGAPKAEYELGVNGMLKKSHAMDATTDSNDELSDSHVVGQVNGGRDSYTFTGEITKLVLRGGAMLYYNGQQVDPAEYLQNTVSVQSQSYAEYDITTTDGIVKSAVKGASDPNDDINGTTASGHVGKGGIDSYAYSGEISNIDIEGEATIYRNGQVLMNPSNLAAPQDSLPSFGQV